MPGVDSVKIKLQKYQQTLTDQMDAMRAELEINILNISRDNQECLILISKRKKKNYGSASKMISTESKADLQAKQQELLSYY